MRSLTHVGMAIVADAFAAEIGDHPADLALLNILHDEHASSVRRRAQPVTCLT